MQETWVRSLGGEDSLEKEMATHSNILAGKIPWAEEPGGLQSMGCKELDTAELTHTHTNIRVSHPCKFPSLVIGLYMSVLSVNLHIPQQSFYGT